ncbi:MAG: hypothetical protein KDD34_01325 [Bdellovibrionales bacterium]|nr:hypothetical protein [Bdellovibrionales bacterium]
MFFLFGSKLTFASSEKNGIEPLCKNAVKISDKKKEQKLLINCIQEGNSKSHECTNKFTSSMTGLDYTSKKDIILSMEAQKNLVVCTTDVGINLVKKYYQR